MDRNKLISGVDEVGRGPLAGVVVAGAVILKKNCAIKGLKDSKKLTHKKRLEYANLIKRKALCWAIGKATPVEIDKLNILQASLLAMQRAVNNLLIAPDEILIDGMHVFKTKISCRAIVHGDDLFPCISAASIIAKVDRDNEMIKLAEQFPQYGFAQHKGYPTLKHIQAIKKYGICPLHRKSFSRVKEYC